MAPARERDDSSVEDIPYTKGKGKQKPTSPEPEDDETGGEDLDEDEYVVEKVLGHRFSKTGVLEFEVQWQGWEETTWEPEENLDGCPEELKTYYDEIGGKPVFKPKSKAGAALESNKKKRKMSEDAMRDTETPPAASKRGRKPKDQANGGSSSGEWKPPVGSWEKEVSEVLTIERDDVGELYGVIHWVNEKKSKHRTAILNAKCPQKMIQFYESHLQFNPPTKSDSPSQEANHHKNETGSGTSEERKGGEGSSKVDNGMHKMDINDYVDDVVEDDEEMDVKAVAF